MTQTTINFAEIGAELAIVGVVILVAVGIHALLQSRTRSEVLRRHNDVAGYLFSAVGVIYAVVLGFIVVVVWEKYDSTVANVDTEIAATSDLYRTMAGFSDPVRSLVRRELRAYTDAVVDAEWPLMARRVNIEKDVDVIEAIAHQVNTYAPRSEGESNAQQMAMSQVERLFDARRNRLIESAPSVPQVLWFALIAGACAMLSFTYFFGVENRPAQLVMTAILAGLIAILFIVISEFDEPFNGSVSISSSSWQTIRQHFSAIP